MGCGGSTDSKPDWEVTIEQAEPWDGPSKYDGKYEVAYAPVQSKSDHKNFKDGRAHGPYGRIEVSTGLLHHKTRVLVANGTVTFYGELQTDYFPTQPNDPHWLDHGCVWHPETVTYELKRTKTLCAPTSSAQHGRYGAGWAAMRALAALAAKASAFCPLRSCSGVPSECSDLPSESASGRGVHVAVATASAAPG